MSDLRINWTDEWEEKDVGLEELRCTLESGDSARYGGKAFRDIGGKWKKHAKCGVSNLYPLKGTEDDSDGPVNAYYAYSITDGVIADEDLEQVRAVYAENLNTSGMRAVCSLYKPNERWGTNPNCHTKLAEKGEMDSLYSFPIAKLFPAGILLTSWSVKKKESQRLACPAIAWGLKEGGPFRKDAYMSYTIDNELLRVSRKPS